MNCALEFGASIFPDRDEFDTEPMVARIRNDKVDDWMTKREYEDIILEREERAAASAAWIEANPLEAYRAAKIAESEAKFRAAVTDANEEYSRAIRPAPGMSAGDYRQQSERSEDAQKRAIDRARRHRDDELSTVKGSHGCWDWERANPYHRDDFGSRSFLSEYEPFDRSSVYYDEIFGAVREQMKQWNRIALIIQGLFDRSEVFHPHAPAALWTPEGFDAAVELVYDGSMVLEPGPAPDFEAYRRAGLESLGADSVTIGQGRTWLERERARERDRRSYDWRLDYRAKQVNDWWTPSWDSGPGYVARVAKWSRTTRTATYRWLRGSRTRFDGERTIRDSIAIPEAELFNVSAYRPGDYLIFFNDPRTRQDYLRWAPLLLTAEEFHAGNAEAGGELKEHDVIFESGGSSGSDGDD
jgi:hypothetical protein